MAETAQSTVVGPSILINGKLQGDEDLTVLGSGVVEIGLGAAFVALPRHRRTVGALLAAFFVAIFPGNIAQYVEGTDAFGLDTDRARFIRLFFQPVLVLVALWGGGWLGRRASSREADQDLHEVETGE